MMVEQRQQQRSQLWRVQREKTIQGERSEEVFHTAKMTEVFPIADVINSIMLIAQMKTMNCGETF